MAEAEFERAIGRVLRWGVVGSSVCLGAGLMATLLAGSNSVATLLLTVGIVLLMATPAARLLVAAIVYAQRRETIFVVLTVIVLAELAASVFAAFRGR